MSVLMTSITGNTVSDLDKIINQNPWLLDIDNIQDDIHLKRLKKYKLIYHEDNFLKHKFEDGVYIVTGPRQIGKSTHLKMLIANKINAKNHKNFNFQKQVFSKKGFFLLLL